MVYELTFPQAGEVEASQTVQMAIAGGILLYLCKSHTLRDILPRNGPI